MIARFVQILNSIFQSILCSSLSKNDLDFFSPFKLVLNFLFHILVFAYMKSVGLEVPNVEVRFEDLNVVADVQTGSRALPTLINYTRDVLEVEYFVLLPFLTVLDKT